MFNWFRNKNKIDENTPDFWRSYLAHFQQKLDKGKLLEEVDFVVFDTETTGLNTKKDRMLSIGAVRVRNNQIDLSDTFDELVEQKYQDKNQQSISIHGILPVDRAKSLVEEDAVQAFLGYIGNSILVGHHVAFDVGMINESVKRMQLGKLKNRMLDTAHLARRVEGGNSSQPHLPYGLDELCQKYKISPSDRHTAAGDAYLTAILFMKLLHKIKKRGIRNLADLLR